ncbi:MAG: hypothetical protein COA42_06580 [Alteromonadaceae bacterium]|nr:MAG: hypothetical protein COA42_06580 [Alteromonadaceae bacterium]
MTENVRLDQAEDILKGFKLPPQPTIFAELKKVAPDIGKMAHIVERDPALAASILKVVNSPAIGMANKVTSIKHAMSLLGLRSIMNIINAAFVKRTISGFANMDQLNNFWYSTTKIAAAMGAIARHMNFKQYDISVDDAYCLGLFHNVGMPMMLDKYEDYFQRIRPTYQKGNIGLVEAENHFFGTNHTVLGFYMTKGWGLPKVIGDVIKIHHNLELIGNVDTLDEKTGVLLAALKMAEQIGGEAEEFGGVDYNVEWVEMSSTITSFMGLSVHDFFDLEDAIFDTIEAELEASNQN